MKKKIALLMAVVMTIATPLTSFAADLSLGGHHAGAAPNVPAKTLFPQATVYSGGFQSANKANATVKDQDIDYIVDGTDLVINFGAGDQIKNGESIEITLNNANFWFAEDVANGDYIDIGSGNRSTFKNDPNYQAGTFLPTTGSKMSRATVAENYGKINVYESLQYTMLNQVITGDAITPNADVLANSLLEYDSAAGNYGAVTVANDQQVYLGYKMFCSNRADSARATITFVAEVDNLTSSGEGKTYAFGSDGAKLRIPMVMRTTNEKDVKAVIRNVNAADLTDINSKDIELSKGTSSTGTTNAEVVNVTTTRTTANIGALNIEDNVPGTISDGIFELELSSGFRFIDNNRVRVSTNEWGTTTFLGYNKDKTAAYFENNVTATTSSIRRAIAITGLEIRITNDYYDFEKETASISIRSFVRGERMSVYPQGSDSKDSANAISIDSKGNASITTRTIPIAYFNNYGLLFGYETSTDNATVTYAGRANVRTPMLRLQERAADSWWSDRPTRFSLTDEDGKILDGVKIAKVVVSGFENVEYPGGRGSISFTEDDDIGVDSYATFDRSYIEITDLKEQSDYKNAKANLQFTINTAANFSGDVYVAVSGIGINTEDFVAPVKIATVKPPVEISTKTTEVAIGHQTYKVADVTIKEDDKNVLRSGKTFSLELDEFANSGAHSNISDVAFNPITMNDIEKDAETTLTFNKVSTGNSKLNLNISRPSTKADAPGEFTIKNLHIRINRSVPYGNIDLIAGGNAIAETYRADATEKSAFFPIKGVVFENYVKVSTPGDSKSFSKNIIVTPDTTTAYSDGKEVTIEPAPFINDVGRVMVPLRALSKLFDIPDTDIIWDSAEGTATVILAGTTNNRIVTFKNGSNIMKVNNVEIKMVDEAGLETTAQITPETNRMFIPWRQLGIAFGIRVEWDGTNAIFNPTPDQLAEVQE